MNSADIRNLIIGVVGSVIVSVASALFGLLGPLGSVCVALAMSLVVLSFALVRVSRSPSRDMNVAGVAAVSKGPNEAVESMLDPASTSIDFWGVSANRTAKSQAGQDAMRRVGQNGGRIRFLLLDPNSANLARRARDEGEEASSWQNEIQSTVTRLHNFAAKHDLDLEIRFFQSYPVWRMIVLDGTTIHVNWFLRGKPGHHSPELKLKSTDDGLFRPFVKEFEEAWSAASHVHS